jgi:dipeptidyl aminopeptidase/acylaminoacyl peptidase
MGIWVFHGAKDPVVKLNESEEMVDALKAAGVDVKFTVYPEAQHDSWTETYNNPELYEWFLQHRRAKP